MSVLICAHDVAKNTLADLPGRPERLLVSKGCAILTPCKKDIPGQALTNPAIRVRSGRAVHPGVSNLKRVRMASAVDGFAAARRSGMALGAGRGPGARELAAADSRESWLRAPKNAQESA
jgi:hypothetical protein